MERGGSPTYELPAARVILVVAAALLSGALAWLAVRDRGDAADAAAATGPVATSEAELAALSERLGRPIYWAGPRDARLELTRTEDGRVYVRYLDRGTEVGDRGRGFLTVATYPYDDAYEALAELARRRGTSAARVGDGIAIVDRRSPESAYFAERGEDVQVEVYSPNPDEAFEVASSGTVAPVR